MEVLGKERDRLGVLFHAVPPGRGRHNRIIPIISMTWTMFDDYFSFETGEEMAPSVQEDQDFGKIIAEKFGDL